MCHNVLFYNRGCLIFIFIADGYDAVGNFLGDSYVLNGVG
jgi:hypothetical protein